MTLIHLYCDEGADPRSVKAIAKSLNEVLIESDTTVKTIDSVALSQTDWEKNTSLLVFPGGRDIPYHTKLQGNSTKRIRSFVEEGGKYLGICAGAYFGCASFEFEKGHSYEVLAARELAFFSGMAIGSAYGGGKFCYNSEKGSHAAKVCWEGSLECNSTYIYFNGGCYFQEAEKAPNIEILARYQDIENRPAAIIGCSIGKGKALLSGVHPEYSAQAHFLQCEHLRPVMKKLSETEALRKRLLENILSYLKVPHESLKHNIDMHNYSSISSNSTLDISNVQSRV